MTRIVCMVFSLSNLQFYVKLAKYIYITWEDEKLWQDVCVEFTESPNRVLDKTIFIPSHERAREIIYNKLRSYCYQIL